MVLDDLCSHDIDLGAAEEESAVIGHDLNELALDFEGLKP